MTEEVELPRAFDDLVGSWDAPLLIVTAADGDELAGCLVAFHTQSSVLPHRYLVALSPRNRTTRVAACATHLAVHAVARHRPDLAERFGGRSGDQVDKFAGASWQVGAGGAPVLTDAAAWFVGRVDRTLPLGGDHGAWILAPIAASPPAPCPLLTTTTLGPLAPGHAP